VLDTPLHKLKWVLRELWTALLPYMYDHPVEHATDRVFDWIREQVIKENQRKAERDL
jgi:hypothetical protein